ncbi:hypothetical protein MZM54_03575 [[Brevibacterium] frigoritolerans]|nr:hypothetical protein [Peribacillus frigoritolerans]
MFLKDFKQKDAAITSTGVVKKWYDDKNHLYIKASSYNRENNSYHNETLMEKIASEIGSLLGINVVDYWLDDLTDLKNKVIKVCVSKDYKVELKVDNFISVKRFLLPMEKEIKTRQDNYHIIVETYPHLKPELDKMIIFDYLIDNEDRHHQNFELYTTNKQEVFLSPLYDNGCSLLSQWSETDLEELEDEDIYEQNIVFAETKSKCFTPDHSTVLRLVGLESYNGLNLDIKKEQFREIIYAYKDCLSELRMQRMYDLVQVRYENLLKDYGCKTKAN